MLIGLGATDTSPPPAADDYNTTAFTCGTKSYSVKDIFQLLKTLGYYSGPIHDTTAEYTDAEKAQLQWALDQAMKDYGLEKSLDTTPAQVCAAIDKAKRDNLMRWAAGIGFGIAALYFVKPKLFTMNKPRKRHASNYPRKSRVKHASWGQPYGGVVQMTNGSWATLYRKGQRCRWYSEGKQIGPEQGNVAPAMAWAMSQGWRI